jgi:SAM-dependent methyltransferase
MLVEGARRGFHMVGVDRSPAMVRQGRVRLQAAAVPACLVQADGQKLPFGDHTFDTVLATFPAGYILDATTLAECRRVLRPAGKLVITGLWVGSGPRWTRLIPVFFGSPEAQARALLRRRIEDHGFCADVIDLAAAEFRIGTIIAEKQSP